MNDRITNIEIQLMHHENTIQQLNDVVTRQQMDIEKLQKQILQMTEHVQRMVPSMMRSPEEEEPPPHY